MIWVNALKCFVRGMAGKWPPAKPLPPKPEPFTVYYDRTGAYRYVILNIDKPGYVGTVTPTHVVAGDSVTFGVSDDFELKSGDTLQIAYTVEGESGLGVYEFNSEGKLL